MPLTTQVKLLRVLETKEFMRIGAETVTKVDVRIIAATNKNLQDEVDARRFRRDLYFRLKAVTLSIPSLRTRKGDIEELVNFFANQYAESNHIIPPEITEEALNLLKEYPWPGNVRELKNTVETALALNKNGKLDSSSFLTLLTEDNRNAPLRNLPIYLKKSPEEVDRELLYRALFEIKKDILELKDLIYHNQNEVYTQGNNHSDEVVPLDEMEKEAIKNALVYTRGNKRDAAKMLKISERTLYRKIKEYDL